MPRRWLLLVIFSLITLILWILALHGISEMPKSYELEALLTRQSIESTAFYSR